MIWWGNHLTLVFTLNVSVAIKGSKGETGSPGIQGTPGSVVSVISPDVLFLFFWVSCSVILWVLIKVCYRGEQERWEEQVSQGTRVCQASRAARYLVCTTDVFLLGTEAVKRSYILEKSIAAVCWKLCAFSRCNSSRRQSLLVRAVAVIIVVLLLCFFVF